MHKTTRATVLAIGILSMLIFLIDSFLLVPNLSEMMDYVLKETGTWGYREYGVFIPTQEITNQMKLIYLNAILTWIFFLFSGIGCILIFLKTETTAVRFDKLQNQQLMRQHAGPLSSADIRAPEEQNKPTLEKGIKPLSEKTKGRILFLSGLVCVLVYSWQFLPLLNSPRLDVTMFMMPLVYALIVACVVGIIAYTIVKYR